MLDLVTWSRNPWSIFDELESLQDDISRTFGGRRGARSRSGRTSYPLMNVWSSEEGIVIDAELPGVLSGHHAHPRWDGDRRIDRTKSGEASFLDQSTESR